MLDRASATPLYVQLAALLRAQIRSHQLLPEAQLPSERELCEQHGVSRITVRQALDELVHEGLIYTSVGKGTYVAELRLTEALQPLSSFAQDIHRRGMAASSQVLEAVVIHADDFLVARLHAPRGGQVVKLRRLRLADDFPIAIQLTYLPHHLCPDLLRYDLSLRSLYDVLRTEYQLNLVSADTNIRAALARAEETRLLQLPTPAAVLITRQTTYLDTGAVIEFVRSVFRADRYELHTSAL